MPEVLADTACVAEQAAVQKEASEAPAQVGVTRQEAETVSETEVAQAAGSPQAEVPVEVAAAQEPEVVARLETAAAVAVEVWVPQDWPDTTQTARR